MKKQKPSINANNELKNAVVKKLGSVIYSLEKGKHNSSFDKELVADVVKQLKDAISALDNAIGTGEEDVARIAESAMSQIENLKKQANQELGNKFESAADELVFTLTFWKDVLDGTVASVTEEELKQAKLSRSRKKLNDRLEELETIKNSFLQNEQRLEKEIVEEEKNIEEYNQLILAEENERKINELYRKIKASKGKIDMLSVRRSNYSACFNLLDMIYANAKEILNATDFASEEIAKAKVLLNIEKLKKVVGDPDQAIAILKRMDKEVKEIASKTATIDEKVFAFDAGNAVVNEDALKYKEELMRKKREKEGLSADIAEGEKVDDCKDIKITEEN